MNRKTTTAFASALLLVSAAAFAGTPAKTTKPAMPAKTEKTATIQKASVKKAPHEATSHKPMPSRHARRHRLASRGGTRETLGDRETDALNALELAGYRNVQDMHATGANIVASVEKNNKRITVTVMPDGKVHPAA
ncbi:MAG: hypothetical protein KGR48_15645 [Alphaproteobacteria bacterium]|nr:hypothetical protein [Alphaproteobacteria bacterium]MBU6471373.1 hypothetical protein [Alphaproteobacteria bacterium]MDE2014675.1 hypothetical protein [Alphaproteobacteria bacterium]MDE2074706.1 hypothetical protein [Alphaproteobacteria bacterium]MDE2352541.1 hypothetical protein [Alphaproteobacteria bacterium]